MSREERASIDHDTELITTNATKRCSIGLSDCSFQSGGGVDEKLVTGIVTVRVVHNLEAVDIAHNDCGVLSAAHRSGEDVVDHSIQFVAVGQTGQLVSCRHAFDLRPFFADRQQQ